jgi:primary-amine oxidase
MASHIHPLAQLTQQEFTKARDAVVAQHASDQPLFFRSIYLDEPSRAELVPFLEAEHAGTLTVDTPRPRRYARVEYDIVKPDVYLYTRAIVDISTGDILSSESVDRKSQAYFTIPEFSAIEDACRDSELFQEAISEFSLPDGFTVTMDPWPYGGTFDPEDPPRYMQGLVFGKDSTKGNDDANHYAYPIPLIPVMDWVTQKVIRVDRLATGGVGDAMEAPERKAGAAPKPLFTEHGAADYVPELLDIPQRTGLKPINVVQPEGASFAAHSDGLVEWQKWRFRIGFTPREGAVLHDVCYDGRPILYRLAYSELTVPYFDPRPPFHRKQAFDLGDAGFGRCTNNLELGCDCLGAIHYLDSLLAAPDGAPTPAKSVVCLHEQDNGVLWKHTNYRTDRPFVTRNRELVVQYIVTLANYEYILAFKLDLAGGITIETRATGIMSVVAIDNGKVSEYGNVVAPGVLAQNHQHVFAVRIDPVVDSYAAGETRVVIEDSVSQKMDPATNPYGNFYKVERQTVDKAQWLDAEPRLNRVLRLENTTKKNPMSGKNVGYKIVSPATQLLLADPNSVHARRAPFTLHHFWVTGYRDGELYAAGEFTNQSSEENGGVAAMVKRGDWFADGADGAAAEGGGQKSSPVVWSVFGFTHNPRVEDWPVMPIETHQMHIRPADFFTANPALDVPSTTKNQASVLVPCHSNGEKQQHSGAAVDPGSEPSVQQSALNHIQ